MSLDLLSRFHTETLNITVGETSYYKLCVINQVLCGDISSTVATLNIFIESLFSNLRHHQSKAIIVVVIVNFQSLEFQK